MLTDFLKTAFLNQFAVYRMYLIFQEYFENLHAYEKGVLVLNQNILTKFPEQRYMSDKPKNNLKIEISKNNCESDFGTNTKMLFQCLSSDIINKSFLKDL